MAAPTHVSRNRLEGSLVDTPFDQLLEACREHLITGTLRISALGREGVVELRAGAVDGAEFGNESGEAALAGLRKARSGEYELTQRLPDMSGLLGSSAQFQGEVRDVPLVQVMRHCEDNALSCNLIVVHEFDRAEIHYRAGEIEQVLFNGKRDDDRIVELVRADHARFRVVAPPLDLGIAGWPSVGREPTRPFKLETAEREHLERAAEAAGKDAVVITAELPPVPDRLVRPRAQPLPRPKERGRLDHPLATAAVIGGIVILGGVWIYVMSQLVLGS